MSTSKWLSKKVVVLGEPAVGKTSLINQFVHHKFSEAYLSTIGLNVVKKSVNIGDYVVDLVLWEIAGQERMMESYLKGGEGVFMVCDLSRPESFGAIPQFKSVVEKVLGEDAPQLVIGNKKDLIEEPSLAEIQQTNPIGIDFYCSAKTGEQVEDFFMEMGRALVEKHKTF